VLALSLTSPGTRPPAIRPALHVERTSAGGFRDVPGSSPRAAQDCRGGKSQCRARQSEGRARQAEGDRPESLADAWAMIKDIWTGTIARAKRQPEPVLHEQVEGEWSFVQTHRHLVLPWTAGCGGW
jgi:hypothetical protein